MKKLKIIIVAILFSFTSYSQIPSIVNDPAANASLTETITNGLKQIDQANQSISLLKEAKEKYELVNNAFATYNYIEDLANLSKNILNKATLNITKLNNTKMFSSKEMNVISGNFQTIMVAGNNVFNVASDLLTEGTFKMTDAERFSLLNEQKKELENLLTNIDIGNKKYLRIAKARYMKKHLFKKS